MRRFSRRINFYLLNPRKLIGRVLGPKVLVMSVQKSGTNLLVHTLDLVPFLRYQGTLAMDSRKEAIRRIENLTPGGVLSSHHARDSELDNLIDHCGIKVLFIIRDPRDVSVSLYYWIEKTQYHHFHNTFIDLPNKDERLMKIITGFEPENTDGSKQGIVSIDYHFRRRLSWMENPRYLTVRFENLIGQSGGGDMNNQLSTLKSIQQFLEIKLLDRDYKYIQDNIFSRRTATFRRGLIGSWKEEFSDAHKAAFKEFAGDLLIDLGYESSLNW